MVWSSFGRTSSTSMLCMSPFLLSPASKSRDSDALARVTRTSAAKPCSATRVSRERASGGSGKRFACSVLARKISILLSTMMRISDLSTSISGISAIGDLLRHDEPHSEINQAVGLGDGSSTQWQAYGAFFHFCVRPEAHEVQDERRRKARTSVVSHSTTLLTRGSPTGLASLREMTDLAALRRGRKSFEERAWAESYRLLQVADRDAPLDAEDLERLAIAAYLVGRDDECEAVTARAHQAFLDRGDCE